MFPTRERYTATLPFPHAIVDGLFDDSALRQVVEEFPDVDDSRWYTFDAEHEQGKQQLVEPGAVWTFPHVAKVLDFLYSDATVAALTEMTGIGGLIPDVVGGGMHQTRAGGYLGMHVDSATDFDDRTLYRRLNVLLYLNRAPSGGTLQLRHGNDCVTVEPTWNRLVIFETGDETWHGHPAPWRADEPRRSLAVYYYTEEMPVNFDPARETTFVA